MFNKESGSDLLSQAKSLLSLAHGRFTVLFGMGRGGTNPLWPPDITVLQRVHVSVLLMLTNRTIGRSKLGVSIAALEQTFGIGADFTLHSSLFNPSQGFSGSKVIGSSHTSN